MANGIENGDRVKYFQPSFSMGTVLTISAGLLAIGGTYGALSSQIGTLSGKVDALVQGAAQQHADTIAALAQERADTAAQIKFLQQQLLRKDDAPIPYMNRGGSSN